MFEGVMIDVAIGMLVIFLVSSLIASAVVESIGGFLHRRSKNLWDTIDLMLGRSKLGPDDQRIVDLIYRQPIISSIVRPTAQPLFEPKNGDETPKVLRRMAKSPPWRGSVGPAKVIPGALRRRRFYGPQSIAKSDFADALLRVLRDADGFDEATDDLRSGIESMPEGSLKAHLTRVMDSAGSELKQMRAGIENWYEDHMKAVSIWYRKQTRWFLFAAGLVMAVVLNVDAIGAAVVLYRDENVRASVVEQAETIVQAECTQDDANQKVDCFRDKVGGAVQLPMGWGDGMDTAPGAWALRMLGWLVVAGSVTIGAPFWFDLLRRVLEYRTKGA